LTLLLVGQPGLLPQIDRMPALEERLGDEQAKGGAVDEHRVRLAEVCAPVAAPARQVTSSALKY
jgi:hypothetical protein